MDAGAHRARERNRPDVAALRDRGLRAHDLLDHGHVVLDQAALVEALLADREVDVRAPVGAVLEPAGLRLADDLAKRIEEGFTDFDVAIATPDLMGTVGRLGRILGPRGLMPNPKTGTVTMDVGKAVRDAKAGKLEYRTDRGANVHVAIGKKSFDERQLVENYAALVEEIVRAKPAVAKGRYIRQITFATTMGPGIHVDTAKVRGIVDELEETPEAVSA